MDDGVSFSFFVYGRFFVLPFCERRKKKNATPSPRKKSHKRFILSALSHTALTLSPRGHDTEERRRHGGRDRGTRGSAGLKESILACRGVKPEQRAKEEVLDDRKLFEDLGGVHLLEPLVHLGPVRDGRGDIVENRRVFVKVAPFDLYLTCECAVKQHIHAYRVDILNRSVVEVVAGLLIDEVPIGDARRRQARVPYFIRALITRTKEKTSSQNQ